MMTDDTRAYWMGYMIGTVKNVARRTHDPSAVDALRVFCNTSSFATDRDREALDLIDSGDDPLYQGNRDDAERSAGLEQQDIFSRRVPDTPGLRLAGVFECEPDESCGARDGAA